MSTIQRYLSYGRSHFTECVPHMFYARTGLFVRVYVPHIPPLPNATWTEHIILMNRIHFASSPSKSVNVYQRARFSPVKLLESSV